MKLPHYLKQQFMQKPADCITSCLHLNKPQIYVIVLYALGDTEIFLFIRVFSEFL